MRYALSSSPLVNSQLVKLFSLSFPIQFLNTSHHIPPPPPSSFLVPRSSSYPLLAVFLCPLLPLLRLIYSHIIPHLHANTMQQLAMQKRRLDAVRHSLRIVEFSVLFFLPSGHSCCHLWPQVLLFFPPWSLFSCSIFTGPVFTDFASALGPQGRQGF